MLKKLTVIEIENSLYDIFEKWLSTSAANQIITHTKPFLSAIPKEKSLEGMNNSDQSVSKQHVEAYVELADQVGFFIENNIELKKQLLQCPIPANDSCIKSFISKFGRDVLRKPLEQGDIDWFYSTYSKSPNKPFQNLVASLFSSPQFIYLLEFGDQLAQSKNDSDVVWLSPFERASKLSYFLTLSSPDDTLYTAAENGSIMTLEGLTTQVDRLLNSPKVQRRISDQFANQWMNLEETPKFTQITPALESMIDLLNVSETIENRREHMIQEVKDYFYYMIWVKNADYQELMTSDLVFPKTPDLAEIYGVSPWNGQFTSESLVRAPANQRAGLLTRAQALFSGDQSTHSIIRGVHVYKNYLCGTLPPPADNSPPEGIVFEDHFSERETIQAMTEKKGSSCVGCHKTLINPLGFAFESYSAFGTFRTQEDIYYPNSSSNAGKILTTKSVNTTSLLKMPYVFEGEVSSGVQLASSIGSSTLGKLCFDQKILSFAQKQNINFGDNDCALEDIFLNQINNKGSIIEAIKAVAKQPEFLKRTLK